MPTTITIQAHHHPGEEQGQLTGSWCAILRSGRNIKPLKGTLHGTDPEKTLLTALTHALRAVLRRETITLHVASSLLAELAPELITHGLACTPLPEHAPHRSDQALWESLLRAAEPHVLQWEPSTSRDVNEAEKVLTETQTHVTAMPLIARPTAKHRPRASGAGVEEALTELPTVFDDEISRVLAPLPGGLHLRLEEAPPGCVTLSIWHGAQRVGYPTLLDNRPFEDVTVQNYRISGQNVRQMLDLLGQTHEEPPGTDAAPDITAPVTEEAYPDLPL